MTRSRARHGTAAPVGGSDPGERPHRVEAYEGEIWVEDGVDGGSVFTVELPIADD